MNKKEFTEKLKQFIHHWDNYVAEAATYDGACDFWLHPKTQEIIDQLINLGRKREKIDPGSCRG